MKASILQLLSILLLIFVINAEVHYEEPDTEGYKIFRLKDLDSELPHIEVKPAEKFIIEIESNPSTGFIWTIEDLEIKHSLETLDLVHCTNLDDNLTGEFYTKKPDGNNKVGVGGFYHFQFQANIYDNTGSETINFIQKRPGTMEGAIEKHVYITITKNPTTTERKDEL